MSESFGFGETIYCTSCHRILTTQYSIDRGNQESDLYHRERAGCICITRDFERLEKSLKENQSD